LRRIRLEGELDRDAFNVEGGHGCDDELEWVALKKASVGEGGREGGGARRGGRGGWPQRLPPGLREEEEDKEEETEVASPLLCCVGCGWHICRWT